MDERPEALLKSALEKIVYFEARSDQLHNDLRAAKAESERLKGELGAASQREIELRRQVAELEVRLNRAQGEYQEQVRLNEVLRLERTELIGKLVEASRIERAASAEPMEDGLDLASFISELRYQAERNQGAQAQAQEPVRVGAKGGAAVAAGGGITGQAVRLKSEGRLEVSTQKVMELSSTGAPFAGRSEETLFGFSVRELSAVDAGTRVRAAERLKALGHAAAAPALATALNAEQEAPVQVSLLSAFAALSGPEGVAIVTPHLQSESAEVRIAALKALLAIDTVIAGPHLAQAVRDQDPSVRRRASLLALSLSGDEAFRLGEHAIADADPEVRRLAALVLGASGKEQARSWLQHALRDGDKKVRQAAAQSLSRLLGEDVAPVVEMDEVQRRREVRRISSLPVRASVQGRPEPRQAPAPVERGRATAQGADEALCRTLMGELRMALRGRSANELASSAQTAVEVVQEAVALLVARGQAVKRGAKYFAA